MWAKDDSGVKMNWVDALEYAKNSKLSGYSDWRLPNSKELQSLVDYEKKIFQLLILNISIQR